MHEKRAPAPPLREEGCAVKQVGIASSAEPIVIDEEYSFSFEENKQVLQAREKRQKLEDAELKRKCSHTFDADGTLKICTSDIIPSNKRPRGMFMSMEQLRALRA